MTFDIPLMSIRDLLSGKGIRNKKQGPMPNRIVRAGYYGRVNTLANAEHMKV